MIMNYINKIKANISIYASKKTSNILDGSYKSIYKGRSLNFEDLREYTIGDNVKDIDWKASARSGNLLVRQYIAEKKHNIMLVFDSGKKMMADAKLKETKKDVSIIAGGTMAYLANKNGDYVGSIWDGDKDVSFYPFSSGLINLEKILSSFDSNVEKSDKSDINKSLEYISKFTKKRMIIFIMTDLDGMETIDEDIIKRLSIMHDIMIINVNDDYITDEYVYDMENNSYVPKLFFNNEKLYELEKKEREKIYLNCTKKFERYRISTMNLDGTKEITMKIIELLERHKNANIR